MSLFCLFSVFESKLLLYGSLAYSNPSSDCMEVSLLDHFTMYLENVRAGELFIGC